MKYLVLVLSLLASNVLAQDGFGPIGVINTVASSSGGGGSWTLKNTGGSALSGLGNLDQTGLSACTDVNVLVNAATTSGSANIGVRVSTDDGSTFLASSGSYLAISSAGVPTNATELLFDSAGPTTAARTGSVLISQFNVVAPKTSRSNIFTVDGIYLRVVPTTTAFNAVRIFVASGTFTGGTVYFFCR